MCFLAYYSVLISIADFEQCLTMTNAGERGGLARILTQQSFDPEGCMFVYDHYTVGLLVDSFAACYFN